MDDTSKIGYGGGVIVLKSNIIRLLGLMESKGENSGISDPTLIAGGAGGSIKCIFDESIELGNLIDVSGGKPEDNVKFI